MEGESPLRSLRRERGLTQRALAELAGVKYVGVISALENGYRPARRSKQAEKVAQALGVSVEDLLAPPRPSRLRELRTQRGLSVYRLAKLAGVRPPVIHAIEHGRRPVLSADPAVKVAALLGVDLAELFDGFTPPMNRALKALDF